MPVSPAARKAIEQWIEQNNVSLADIFGPEPTRDGIEALRQLATMQPFKGTPALIRMAQEEGLALDYNGNVDRLLWQQAERYRASLLRNGEFGIPTPRPYTGTIGPSAGYEDEADETEDDAQDDRSDDYTRVAEFLGLATEAA